MSRVKHLVVDTNAFINSAPIREIGESVYTVGEVIDEVKCKKQLRHLSVLAYDLVVKDVFAENIKFVTEFSKKTGDYSSLSAVDLKVIALAYQLEKEKVGTDHLNVAPKIQTDVTAYNSKSNRSAGRTIGFFLPAEAKDDDDDDDGNNNEDDGSVSDSEDLESKLAALKVENPDDILVPIKSEEDSQDNEVEDRTSNGSESDDDDDDEDDEDDEDEWITVDNLKEMKKKLDGGAYAEDSCTVACMTADFAMQNVLKQIGLNVSSYDGRMIRKVRTFILRCTTCFKTTSVMTKKFCPVCGHPSLKKVSVSLDENGKRQIFINLSRPLTSRGKRFSLPAPRGGQHAQNPVLNADQAFSRSRPTKLARMKNNPLDDDYIAGYSPFVMRDVNSRSAVLGIKNNSGDVKYWMRKNPNEVRRKRK